jgi:subtilisin family serine protease
MIPVTLRLRGALAAALASLLVAACGGGGSGDVPANASQPQSVPLQAQAPMTAAAPSTVSGAQVDSDKGGRQYGQTKITNKLYIVQLAEKPATAYTGGVQGLAATKPRKGQKIDPDSPQVRNYIAYLASRHDTVMKAVGATRKVYSYGYVYNGFAAEMTEAQAQRLSAMKGVLSVTKDETRPLDTSTTPTFLGLAGPGGFWNTTGATGENIIIGMVDSGIWPEHPSFSDRTGTNGNATKDGKVGYQQIAGWHGKCVPGTAFTATNCNQKMIGARYYNDGWGGNAGVSEQFPWDFNSPRDYDGHGTHTASTAGGNAGVSPTGIVASLGVMSGIAPRARIAAYKVCWGGLEGGCTNSDSVAAIDQAVADGVDVINFSIGGSRTNFLDPVEVAFLFAADAGVFVATSAGNNGPTVSTVAHPGPWLTTVAAGTHSRSGTGSVTLGNGAVYQGASMANPVGPAPFIDSTAAGLPGADPTMVALCYAASDNGGTAVLDPAKITGKIVLCDRGVTGRTSKSQAVKEAGGIGMVLVNTSNNSINADAHAVPTVHLQFTERPAMKAYAATVGATASIGPSTITADLPAPLTASFSSRGPLLAGGGDLLKPDIMAPGQDILAGVAPPGNNGKLFDLYSGTSMSSPHIAGIAALFKQVNPTWSPMAIKSALMTTAGDVLDGPNTNPLVVFRQGAGHVQPMAALNPGLVFDSGYNDWIGFLCGTQLSPTFCTNAGIPVLDASNLNVASIAIGDMAGVQTVTRRVTNVGGATATYTPSYTGMTGIDIAFAPASLTLAPGETKSFTVSFTRTTAAANAYTAGQLKLSDGTHSVRVPMVIKPVALAAPVQVGSGSYNVTFGYTGPFTASPRGLIPATVTPGSVATDATVDFSIVVPAGATYARFSLFDAEVNQAADLDLEVYLNGTLVGNSGSATSAEEVNLVNPAAGTYTVRVVGYAVPVGAANFKLFSWVLGDTAAGNMTVTAPATAATGATGTITIGTTGLTAGTKYLGSVAYGGATPMPNPTIVRIDP